MPGTLCLPSGAVHCRLLSEKQIHLSSKKCIWRVQIDPFVSSWQVFILKNMPAYLASWTSLWETKIVNMRNETQIGKVRKKWSCEIWNGNIHTNSGVKRGGFLSPRKELKSSDTSDGSEQLPTQMPASKCHSPLEEVRAPWEVSDPHLKQRKDKVGLEGLMSKRKEVLKWGHVKRSEGSAGRSPPPAQFGTVTLLV